LAYCDTRLIEHSPALERVRGLLHAQRAKFFSRSGRPYGLRVFGQWLSDSSDAESITNLHRQDIVRISALPIAIEL
jgi:hypothetical protein